MRVQVLLLATVCVAAHSSCVQGCVGLVVHQGGEQLRQHALSGRHTQNNIDRQFSVRGCVSGCGCCFALVLAYGKHSALTPHSTSPFQLAKSTQRLPLSPLRRQPLVLC